MFICNGINFSSNIINPFFFLNGKQKDKNIKYIINVII